MVSSRACLALWMGQLQFQAGLMWDMGKLNIFDLMWEEDLGTWTYTVVQWFCFYGWCFCESSGLSLAWIPGGAGSGAASQSCGPVTLLQQIGQVASGELGGEQGRDWTRVLWTLSY